MHFQAAIAQKMEVDFAGQTFTLVDGQTGEICTVVVFVLLQGTGCDLVQFQLPDDRLDIVPDQACIAGIHGDRPLRFPILFFQGVSEIHGLYAQGISTAFRDGEQVN